MQHSETFGRIFSSHFKIFLMAYLKQHATAVAIFCKVVDNYGDIGICWRLSRQLCHEHGADVTLWVDDLHSFRRLCDCVEPGADVQTVEGVTVRHWIDDSKEFAACDIADIVIEFFGCDIPESYIAAMAACNPRPAWLNLEGLSAEAWVEGCHTLPSPHPRMPLMKYFFFPGFTAKTGGLLRECSLLDERDRFQSNPREKTAFLDRVGVTHEEAAAVKISLFCYPHAPVTSLFDVWQARERRITCLVPEGVAVDAVQAFLEAEAKPGTVRTQGGLTVRVVPFLSQPDYDRLLWSCDVNVVRGEDSFVRAQWAGKPFVWHIYPQDEHLHHKKLNAFLQRHAQGMNGMVRFWLGWNDAGAESAGSVAQDRERWSLMWQEFAADLPMMTTRAAAWQQAMLENGDLTSNMLKFAASVMSKDSKNPL